MLAKTVELFGLTVLALVVVWIIVPSRLWMEEREG